MRGALLRRTFFAIILLSLVYVVTNLFRLVSWTSRLPRQIVDLAPLSSRIDVKKGQQEVTGISCKLYGGPSEDKVAEMVYWRDIESDSVRVSQFAATGPSPKYLTFEPDEGGWNNIRMAMETTVALALAMGRTLVLPPDTEMYLLSGDNRTSFADFFDLESAAAENDAFNIVRFQEFLEREAVTGHLIDMETGTPTFPPSNRTDWNGVVKNWESTKGGKGKELWNWLRSATTSLGWSGNKCVAAFPAKTGEAGVQNVYNYLNQIKANDRNAPIKHVALPPWRQRVLSFIGNPTPVNASAFDRLTEMLAHRRQLCVYDEELQQAKVIHVNGEQRTGNRLLIPFYAFVFLEDWRQDLWIKRFVRDHLRYIDEIQCAAARVVRAVRLLARIHGDVRGSYDSFHIRRGDFQYEMMRLTAEEIYLNNTRNMLRENRTVFVATDEKQLSFFDPLREHYHLLFLNKFHYLLRDIPPKYYGMIDQLVASRGDTFVGAYFSTFSSYINRIRGYQSQKEKTFGYQHGIIDSYYYAPDKIKPVRQIMKTYKSVERSFWQQEFPISWRGIDYDVEDNH